MLDRPNFSRWFDGSTVVDAKGQPMVVYHGTYKQFDAFSSSGDLGFHAGTILAANERIHQERRKAKNRDAAPSILPLYMRLKNPLDIADQITWQPYSVANALKEMGVLNACEASPFAGMDFKKNCPEKEAALKSLANMLKAQGFDGLRYINLVEGTRRAIDGDVQRVLEVTPNACVPPPTGKEFVARYRDSKYPVGFGPTEIEAMAHAEKRMRKEKRGLDHSYIAFEPQQLKSALGNSGLYDLNDPDLTDSRALAAGKALDFLRTKKRAVAPHA